MKLDALREKFIIHLAETGALKFGDYTMANKRKSPYFINVGAAMNDGRGAAFVSACYARAIKELKLEFDYIHGPAYKGIPLACLIADKLLLLEQNKRWGYNRKEEKKHGDAAESKIVGDLRDGDRALIVDDVLTSGATKVKSYEQLKVAKAIRPGAIIVVAVDREELMADDIKLLADNNLIAFSFLKISEIFSYLHNREINGKIYVDDEKMDSFKRYLSSIKKSR